jgi:hypothetical protein
MLSLLFGISANPTCILPDPPVGNVAKLFHMRVRMGEASDQMLGIACEKRTFSSSVDLSFHGKHYREN